MSRLERQLRLVSPRSLYHKRRKSSVDAMLLNSMAPSGGEAASASSRFTTIDELNANVNNALLYDNNNSYNHINHANNNHRNPTSNPNHFLSNQQTTSHDSQMASAAAAKSKSLSPEPNNSSMNPKCSNSSSSVKLRPKIGPKPDLTGSSGSVKLPPPPHSSSVTRSRSPSVQNLKSASSLISSSISRSNAQSLPHLISTSISNSNSSNNAAANNKVETEDLVRNSSVFVNLNSFPTTQPSPTPHLNSSLSQNQNQNSNSKTSSTSKQNNSKSSNSSNFQNYHPEEQRRLSRLLREVNERREIRERHDSYASEVSLEANMIRNEELELQRITKIQRSKRLLVKYKIYDFLKRPATFGAMIYHVFAFLLVFACLILSIYPDIETEIGKVYAILDIMEKSVLLLFTAEFVIMLWCCECRPQYQGCRGKIAFIKSPAHFIDLIVIILSAVLPSFSSSHDGHEVFAFRAFRGFHRFFQLLQVIALKRQLRPWRLFWSVLYDQREQLLIIFYLEIVLLCLLSYLGFLVEHQANQNLENIADAMWWSIVTLTTVGYGDKVPVTWMGKLISAFFILFGVAVFALPAGIIGAGLALKLEEVERTRQRRLKKEAAARLIQHAYKCHQANRAYYELSAFFRHQPGDLYKVRVYDHITKAFIATAKFHLAKAAFKELTRPVDLRNVIESFKYGQMDIFARLKQLNSALDLIISRMTAAENERIMAINHLAKRLEEVEYQSMEESQTTTAQPFSADFSSPYSNPHLRLLDLVNLPPMPQTSTHPSTIPRGSRHSTRSPGHQSHSQNQNHYQNLVFHNNNNNNGYSNIGSSYQPFNQSNAAFYQNVPTSSSLYHQQIPTQQVNNGVPIRPMSSPGYFQQQQMQMNQQQQQAFRCNSLGRDFPPPPPPPLSPTSQSSHTITTIEEVALNERGEKTETNRNKQQSAKMKSSSSTMTSRGKRAPRPRYNSDVVRLVDSEFRKVDSSIDHQSMLPPPNGLVDDQRENVPIQEQGIQGGTSGTGDGLRLRRNSS